MEVFLIPTTLLGLILLLLFSFFRSRQQQSSPRLPPGNAGWPFIGETIAFVRAGRRGEPRQFISERMSRFSDSCFRTRLLAENMAVVCGPQGNKLIFSNETKLVSRWWPASVNKVLLSRSTQGMTGDERYNRLMAIFLQFVKPNTFSGYVGGIDAVAAKHFADFWDSGDQILVSPLSKTYTFSVGCKLLLSLEEPREIACLAETFDVVTSGLIRMPVNLPGTSLNRAIRCAELFRNKVKEIIRQRKIDLEENRATPTQDMLSIYLTTKFDGDKGDGQKAFMSDDEISENILGTLMASYDTVSAAVTLTVKYLAELPHIYQGVYEEQMEIAKSKGEGELLNWNDIQKMKYSWNVVCEVMRLEPPSQGAFREALQDITFDGFLIPKGWKLYWTVSSTHHNPKYFPDPEKFDPLRFEGSGRPAPYTFVPFGGGPRMCAGKEYARLYILAFIHNVVKRYKWEKLVEHEKTIINPYPVPEKGLPIRIHRHME